MKLASIMAKLNMWPMMVTSSMMSVNVAVTKTVIVGMMLIFCSCLLIYSSNIGVVAFHFGRVVFWGWADWRLG